jgi:pyruvate dehydrogenase E1 component alpha subunit
MNKEEKVELYRRMLRIRLVEEAIAREYPKGEMRCPVHLSIGQELLPTLVSLVTSKTDLAVSTHRSHAHYLAKGGSLQKFVAELFGKSTGCSKGRGGSMHLIDLDVNFMGSTAIVGNSIPVGVGLGYGAKLRGDKAVVLIYLGDGAVEEGAFYESVNFAAVRKIPAIFLCENNNFSVYSHISERQPEGRRIYNMVEGLGINSKYLDSSNPEKSLVELSNIIETTRLTQIPSFIEIDTFRFLEHCGPAEDDHLGYRESVYIADAKRKDPLLMMSLELVGLIKDWDKVIAEMTKVIDKEIEVAFDFARNSDYPDPQIEGTSAFAGAKS